MRFVRSSRRLQSSTAWTRCSLFGSYARGDATPASDVDLCVDAPKLRGLFALGGLYADLEDALKKSIDVVTTGSLKYNKDEAFLENLRKRSGAAV